MAQLTALAVTTTTSPNRLTALAVESEGDEAVPHRSTALSVVASGQSYGLVYWFDGTDWIQGGTLMRWSDGEWVTA